MKKLLLICLAVIGISAVSRAQGGGMRRTPAEQVAQLKTSLALTDDQSAKVLAIYTAQAKTQDSLRTAGADRSAMMAVRTATMAKINAVLTPDQAATFKKQQDEMRARMQQGGGMGGGGGTPPPPSNR
ncbi:MAG: hypothetical protein ACXVAY_13165 [Mucilaginibacter sp.]